jgi:hypothetical protein
VQRTCYLIASINYLFTLASVILSVLLEEGSELISLLCASSVRFGGHRLCILGLFIPSYRLSKARFRIRRDFSDRFSPTIFGKL